MRNQIVARASALAAAIGMTLWSVAAAAQAPTPAGDEGVAQAVPIAEAQPSVARPVVESARPGSSSAAPLVATLQLNVGDTQLRGMLLSATQITVKTSFGEVDVPLSEVAGIKLASNTTPTTTVVLHNGDSITGGCALDRIQLQTEWGRADVEGTAINSIVFAEGLTWVLDSKRGGGRWELITKAANPYKQGDTIIVTRDTQLKYGENVVGAVRKNEVLTVQNVEGAYVLVRTRNNGTGWLDTASAQPYQQPQQ